MPISSSLFSDAGSLVFFHRPFHFQLVATTYNDDNMVCLGPIFSYVSGDSVVEILTKVVTISTTEWPLRLPLSSRNVMPECLPKWVVPKQICGERFRHRHPSIESSSLGTVLASQVHLQFTKGSLQATDLSPSLLLGPLESWVPALYSISTYTYLCMVFISKGWYHRLWLHLPKKSEFFTLPWWDSVATHTSVSHSCCLSIPPLFRFRFPKALMGQPVLWITQKWFKLPLAWPGG